MQSIEKNLSAMESFTDKLTVAPELEYDAYVGDRPGEYRRSCQAVGVASPHKLPQEKFEKITPENLSDVIENYGEVAEYAQQKGQMI